jgi:acylphosphatase
MIKHLNIHIYGRVQGVFYRASAMEAADKLGVKGFARNEKDGSVYIEAEGEDDDLREFISWCYKGPARASVDRIATDEANIKNFTKFTIER